MSQLFRLVLLFVSILLLAPDGKSNSVISGVDCNCNSENKTGLEPAASIQAPVIPPFYFLSKEESVVSLCFDSMRNQFVLIQPNRMPPANFCFRKDISLTAVLIDHEAPVPLFIQEHALIQ